MDYEPMFESREVAVVIALVVIVVALLVLGVALDFTARRAGHRLRSPGDIRNEIRQQRLQSGARQAARFRRTGDDGSDASFSPDREQRLGK